MTGVCQTDVARVEVDIPENDFPELGLNKSVVLDLRNQVIVAKLNIKPVLQNRWLIEIEVEVFVIQGLWKRIS